MNTFHLRVLTANRTFFDGDCESLVLPASDGLFGVQAGHAPMVAALVPGEMTLRLPGDRTITAFVSEGILRVGTDGALLLAADAETPEEIDAARAEADVAEEEELQRHKQSSREYEESHARLVRALNRLKVKNHK